MTVSLTGFKPVSKKGGFKMVAGAQQTFAFVL